MGNDQAGMKNSSSLLLLGYRATGKSSAGRILAARTGAQFVDTDSLIEKQAGETVSEIVMEQGWPGFRAMEKEALRQALHLRGSVVIAGGGGVVLHEDILKTLSEDICTVWLRASVDTIVSRIAGDNLSKTLRPSLKENASLKQEVEEVLGLREALYRRYSMFIIDTDRLGLGDIADKLAVIWKGAGGIF